MSEKLEPPSSFNSPEEEISFLREQIANKESELREKNLYANTEDVVKEQISRYKEVLPKDVLDETYKIAEHDVESIVLNLSPEPHDKKMMELISSLEEKGIKNTLSI